MCYDVSSREPKNNNSIWIQYKVGLFRWNVFSLTSSSAVLIQSLLRSGLLSLCLPPKLQKSWGGIKEREREGDGDGDGDGVSE